MYKTLCRNNLGTIGKWGGTNFLFGFVVTAFVVSGTLSAHAFVLETNPLPSTQPATQLQTDLNSIGKLNNIAAPLTNLINNAIKSFGLSPKVNIGTGIPLSPIKNPSQGIDFSKFFSSSNVSSTDVLGFLKEAALTAINLTILVFSIASQVLKGILSVFKP